MVASDKGWLSGWGRQAVPGREVRSEDLERLTVGATLSRGLGRAYGDSALPAPGQLDTQPSDTQNDDDKVLTL